MKNDSVRSWLIELQSFLQSKIDVEPIYRVLIFLPRCLHVLCKTRCFQVDRIRIFVSADILSKPLHQQSNVHDSPLVRSNSLRYHVDVKKCDDTIFSSRFEPEDCMRTFKQSEPTRLLSSLQGASLSQQHLRCHMIQCPYHQYPQVPTVSLVPCPTLLNTVPTHFTQRVAAKPDFGQQCGSVWSWVRPLFLKYFFEFFQSLKSLKNKLPKTPGGVSSF